MATPPSPSPPCANHPAQPSSATCGRCGDFICAQCSISDTGLLLCPRCHASQVHSYGIIPWEQRQERGLVLAYLQTVKESALSPGTFFANVNPRGSYKDGALFVLLSGYLSIGAAVALEFVGLLLEERDASLPFEADVAIFGGVSLAVALLMPLLLVPLIFVQAAAVHVCCMVVGADDGGYRGTFRGLCYTTGIQSVLGALTLLLVLAACGGFVSIGIYEIVNYLDRALTFVFNLFSLVLLFFAVREVHRVSSGRALAAVVIPVVLIVLAVCLCFGLTGLRAFGG